MNQQEETARKIYSEVGLKQAQYQKEGMTPSEARKRAQQEVGDANVSWAAHYWAVRSGGIRRQRKSVVNQENLPLPVLQGKVLEEAVDYSNTSQVYRLIVKTLSGDKINIIPDDPVMSHLFGILRPELKNSRSNLSVIRNSMKKEGWDFQRDFEHHCYIVQLDPNRRAREKYETEAAEIKKAIEEWNQRLAETLRKIGSLDPKK